MKDYVNVKPARKPWISSGVKCRLCDMAAVELLALVLMLNFD